MVRINTDIENVIVEIDDTEYDVAAKTVEIAERLLAVQQRCKGKPEYLLWLAELEVLLGKPAIRKLFSAGQKENIDRIQRIHAGVLRAFEYNSDVLRNEDVERVIDGLSPVNDLLKHVATLQNQNSKKVIHKEQGF